MSPCSGLPVLYSFRRCPYAMRARLALYRAKIEVEHREILLKNKPPQMLQISPKGTVPVLLLPNGEVIDESRDLAIWALGQSTQHGLLWATDKQLDQAQLELIANNDDEFKHWLDRYKYQVGYPEHPAETYRDKAQVFLNELEQRLASNQNLFGDQPSFADIAIFPFVRQFAFVDKSWFDRAPYPQLQGWLNRWIRSEEFDAVMIKHSEWRS